eukprot:COSAG05_NODE_12_length_37297_cov_117.537072_5_plen_194_part_00
MRVSVRADLLPKIRENHRAQSFNQAPPTQRQRGRGSTNLMPRKLLLGRRYRRRYRRARAVRRNGFEAYHSRGRKRLLHRLQLERRKRIVAGADCRAGSSKAAPAAAAAAAAAADSNCTPQPHVYHAPEIPEISCSERVEVTLLTWRMIKPVTFRSHKTVHENLTPNLIWTRRGANYTTKELDTMTHRSVRGVR